VFVKSFDRWLCLNSVWYLSINKSIFITTHCGVTISWFRNIAHNPLKITFTICHFFRPHKNRTVLICILYRFGHASFYLFHVKSVLNFWRKCRAAVFSRCIIPNVLHLWNVYLAAQGTNPTGLLQKFLNSNSSFPNLHVLWLSAPSHKHRAFL